jgi:CHASE3 domain sensor protein
MTTGSPPGGDDTAGPAPLPSDPQQLRDEIRRTRAELGDTVEALARRVDVKARARETAASARQRARDRATAVTRALADRGAQLKEQLGDATAPDQADAAATQARTGALRGGLPLLAAAGVVLACWLVWRWRRS